jgi:hypothetical protein
VLTQGGDSGTRKEFLFKRKGADAEAAKEDERLEMDAICSMIPRQPILSGENSTLRSVCPDAEVDTVFYIMAGSLRASLRWQDEGRKLRLHRRMPSLNCLV